jgi:Arc/MetJ-type ribon-helix-helix transcriptional regulator
MYKDAKKAQIAKRYSSVSELIRDALRKTLYDEVTPNGFTKEFEDHVLESSHEPEKNDIVFKTEKDLVSYFNGQNKTVRKI